MLVLVDGNPVFGQAPGSKLLRVLNTRALILQDAKAMNYVHVWDGWMQSPSLSGPWTVAKEGPRGGDAIAKELAAQKTVDLLTGTADETTKQLPTLKKDPPALLVATRPTELVVFEGAPDWVPIDGTNLLYVANTTGNVFIDIQTQVTYVLVTGRWFSAPDLNGPWTYVPGKSLPPDFAQVPDGSPKENMKASVPGTPQAASAVIAAGIPQQATVDRTKASFTSNIAGAPQLKPIPGTPLQYVFNSPDPILMVSPTEWYSLYLGIWFTAQSPAGPWLSAMAVPAVIYSIPPSSPLYWVTYVKIYDATPQYVTVGYTPGLPRRGGDARRRGGLRHGLRLPGLRRRDGLVPAPRHLRLRRGHGLDPLDRLGHGLRLRPRHGGRHVGPGAVLGRGLGLARRRGLGSGGLGGDVRKRLPPVGKHRRGDEDLGRLQRLERQRLVEPGGPLLQFHDRPHQRRAARDGRERLHRELRP